MEDPYRSPTQAIELPVGPAFRWKRVMVWAALIYCAAMAVGFSSGLSMGAWEIYGNTMEIAIENARLVRQIAYGVVGTILYWRLAAPVRQRLLHVAAAFLTVQLIDAVVSLFVFRIPASELIDPSSLGRSLLAAVVGLALASAGSWMSSRPSLRST